MVQIEHLWPWFWILGSEVEFVIQQKNFLNHRLNRRLVFPASVQPVLNSSWLSFCIISGSTSYRYTDGHRCIRWLADEPTPQHQFFRCYRVEFWPLQRLWTFLLQLHRRPSDAPMLQQRFFRCLSVDQFQNRSNLVNFPPTVTLVLHSMNRRCFRCFRV